MTELKKGDTVRLRSGGPLMTVSGKPAYCGDDKWICVWFDGTTQKRATFAAAALELAELPRG